MNDFILPREQQWVEPVTVADTTTETFQPADNTLVYAAAHTVGCTGTVDITFYKGDTITRTETLTDSIESYFCQGCTKIDFTATGASTVTNWSE